MTDNVNTGHGRKKIIVYILLALAVFAVFGQARQFGFVNIDDSVYVTGNSHIQSGITLKGIRWAFSSTSAEFWHPMTWLSLMFDYQLHGLNPSGYHFTNVLLHIMSALLFFSFLSRATGAVWKSAFVAALFALHPLHVESVAWIAERKDTLSAFFWMFTLCFYVYYTEKPSVGRYLLVAFFFACALMSKSMVVTLPVIMILLDYWPLKRFGREKENIILWQLREKTPLFLLSAVISIITLYAQHNTSAKYALVSRLANAPVSFVAYLEKTFYPYHLAVFYPFSEKLSLWQIWGSALLIVLITIAVIAACRRAPYLFTGWSWFAITILPVIGIIQIGDFSMADRYHYLPSVGLGIMLSWGIPSLMNNENTRRKILFPVALVFIVIMSFMTWKQCGYWRDSITLFEHAVRVTKNNYMAYADLGVTLLEQGKTREALDNFNRALKLKPDYPLLYANRGQAYAELGQYENAFEDFNKAIRLRPDYAKLYNGRGIAYSRRGLYNLAIGDFNEAIRLKPDDVVSFIYRGDAYFGLGQYREALEDYYRAESLRLDYAEAYFKAGNVFAAIGNNPNALENYSKAIHYDANYAEAYGSRGAIYLKLGKPQQALEDFKAAIRLNPGDFKIYNNRGILYVNMGQAALAISDFTKAISLKEDYAAAYNNRAFIYLNLGDKLSGCRDAKKACEMKYCETLKMASSKGMCR